MPRILVPAAALVGWTIAVSAAVLSPVQAGVAPSPSATTDREQPLLSIAVDNGRTVVAAGDEVTYKIRIRNLGTTEAEELQISQSLPAGLTLVSADRDGKARTGSVTWSVDLKAGQESVLSTIARVGQTPDEVLRLATVACAAVKDGPKPLVCATHSDLLPAGAAAAARVDHPRTPWLWYLLAAAAVVAAGGLAAIVGTRRSRRRQRLRRHAVPTTARRDSGDPVGAATAE